MKLRASVVALALVASSTAQAMDPVVSAIMPHPVTIALTVGRWLLEDSKKTYYVQVAAEADSFESAKTEAFRLAVDQAVGSLLQAESEIKNGEVGRKDIVTYSSGYVERFEIKSRAEIDGRTKLVVDVWVSGNNIQNRLLAVSKTAGQVAGEQANAAISSYMLNRTTGDRSLELVLADYPKRAFHVEAKQTAVKIDEYRKTNLIVPLEISWDYNYVLALAQVLESVRDNQYRTGPSSIKIMAKDPKAWIAGWQTTAGFNDIEKYSLAYKYMVESQPVVQVLIKNSSGTVVFKDCYSWRDFQGQYQGEDQQFLNSYYTGQNYGMNIYGNHKLVGHVAIPIDAETVRDLTNVEMAVLSTKECRI
jgi:hypothetical protein